MPCLFIYLFISDTREAQHLFKFTQTVDIGDDDMEISGEDAFERMLI
jgi:hypothetical protein